MLTHALLLAWYTTTMTQVDLAAVNVRANQPVVFPLLPTIEGARTWTHISEKNDNIMACLVEGERARAGIVHYPHTNVTWAIVDHEWMERPKFSLEPTEQVIVSGSFPQNGYPPLKSSGDMATDLVRVLRGDALAFIGRMTFETKDVCAFEPMVAAVNGTIVDWHAGNRLNFSKTSHDNGLYVSTTAGREWFRLVARLRTPMVQFVILGIAWLCIYLYPDTVAVNKGLKKTPGLNLVKCILTLATSQVAVNVLQDHMLRVRYDGKSFESTNAIMLFGHVVVTLFSETFLKQRSTPMFYASVSSVASIAAYICLFAATKSVSEPVVDIFKSLRMLTVVGVGQLIFRKSYTKTMYLVSVAIAGGVAICLMSRYSPPKDALNVLTGAALVGFLLFSAFASQWVEYLYQRFHATPIELIWAIHCCSAIFLGLLCMFTGELRETVEFTIYHSTFAVHIVIWSVLYIVNQWFALKTIEQHGAPVYALIVAASKAFSLVGFGIFHNETVHLQAYAGLLVVLSTLYLVTKTGVSRSQKYAKVPQKDPEAQYDSMDEYDLESDHED